MTRSIPQALITLLAVVLLLQDPMAAHAEEPLADAIDRVLAGHWRKYEIQPASPADEAVLYRRVMLDLAGRIPTAAEAAAFRADRSPDRNGRAVQKLLDGPEFSWHFGTVLDEMIQGPQAGNAGFVGYLRRAMRDGKRWDAIFREVLIGPWDNDERKPAAAFLDRRARDLDLLTADVTRSFFGVDISCARCHNHPLVRDWKREHYYGMAAFLVRTTGGKGAVAEKADGEAKFAGKDGVERVAKMMFLSGRTVDEPARPTEGKKPPAFSRRAELVRIALEDRTFLSRAFVNRVWEYFLGRGLVDPVDQIHSGNPASVPELLELLAKDFADHGHDIRRLVAGIVLSRAYRLDTRPMDRGEIPAPEHFAVSTLRPLSPRQLAQSLLIALGDGTFEPSVDGLQSLEKKAADLAGKLDPRTREFQSSGGEALFLSNGPAVRNLVTVGSKNLAERLAGAADDRTMVADAFTAILGRGPTPTEADRVLSWLARSGLERRAAAEDLAWALAASAEFRFNH